MTRVHLSASDARNLLGRLALPQDHLGHSLAQRPVVVDLGEAEFREGQALELLEGLVGLDLAGPDSLEQVSQPRRVHDSPRSPGDGQRRADHPCAPLGRALLTGPSRAY